MSTTTISVCETPEQLAERKGREKERDGKLPSHWVNGSGTHFRNPWPSYRDMNLLELYMNLPNTIRNRPHIPDNYASSIGLRRPSWGDRSSSTLSEGDTSTSNSKIKATWLGHACLLVELPSTSSLGRGPRILFDPVFSDRCSPVQFMGPKRYSPAPCPTEDLPEIDAIVISHNHYDHLDTNTISTLYKRSARKPHIFAPLGNQDYFSSFKEIPKGHAHVLDWWEQRRLKITLDEGDKTSLPVEIDITCTPAQHRTGRGIRDQWKSLWAGWVVQSVPSSSSSTPEPSRKVFFAGDTGYRTVRTDQGEDENNVPFCPAFKEIGDKFGEIDLALIPIGAYDPRHLFSPVHASPSDSVRIFQDVRAKRGLGMHWGTWVLTTEDVAEPPRLLKEECQKAGIEDGIFGVCGLGETCFF